MRVLLAALCGIVGICAAQAQAQPIRRGRSLSWCRSRPAGRPIDRRASWASACAQSLGQTDHDRERHRRRRLDRRRPRRARGTRRLHARHRPCRHACASTARSIRCSYDLLNDLEPIALLASQSAADRDQDERAGEESQELIAWLKANPGKVAGGTAGVGARLACRGDLLPEHDRHATSTSCPIAAPGPRCRTSSPARST